ncbi:hypothetical protein BDZ45DRAFT_312852 [Acephala macrosclerotiorum]|nr:hypothetical protein BDZ45DRAFT_312852 [Acephala macrosclerotiorum]
MVSDFLLVLAVLLQTYSYPRYACVYSSNLELKLKLLSIRPNSATRQATSKYIGWNNTKSQYYRERISSVGARLDLRNGDSDREMYGVSQGANFAATWLRGWALEHCVFYLEQQRNHKTDINEHRNNLNSF